MSFWGASKAQKNAQGAMGNAANTAADLTKTDLAQQQNSTAKANALRDQFLQQANARYQKGFGTQADINTAGQGMMPGVDKALANQSGRINTMAGRYDNLQPMSTTTNDTTARLGNIYNKYGDTGNDLIKRSEAARNWNFDQTTGAYDQAVKRIAPGSDLTKAAVAQSYAPALAQVNQRLRSMGVDPNSPEGNSALAQVQSQMAHTQDQVAQNGIAQMNQLDLARHGELRDTINNSNNQVMDAVNNAGDKQASTLAAMNANEVQNRGLAEHGVNNQNSYDLARNQQDTNAVNMKNAQTQSGVQYVGMNNAERNAASQSVADQGNAQYQVGLGYGSQAGQNNQAAFGMNNNIYQREAANSGWGRKMIAGAAGAATNMFVPGAGGLVSGAIAGGGGGQQQGGGGGFSFQNPFSKGGNSSYDPWGDYGASGGVYDSNGSYAGE